MKLLFLSDNFPPEVNAPATRTFEHCREWARSGTEVTVITCFPNFPEGKVYAGYKNKLFQKENIEGIHVVRVFTYITANQGFYKRTIDYISFGLSAFLAGLFIRTDLIVATSPQFFAAISGRWLSFFKRKPWVMEVRDLWPESIKTVGAMTDNFVIRYFERLELRLYRSARQIITVTDSFKKNIIKKGISPEKIFVIKNGANLALYTPRQKNQQILTELGLTGKFIVGFIGTLGMAHKLDFIIKAASKINDTGIHFLFIGAGAERKHLELLIEAIKPGNVTLLGMIQKDRVPDYLSAIDVSLINLRKAETFKAVIPSKIFESAAMEKPILLGVDGESRQIVESYPAGLYFEPENEYDFIEKLYLLKSDKALYESLKRGCQKLVKDFDRVSLAKDMAEILYTIGDNHKG
jgi:glycosyltransferase involved in cell wall biosynthesis